MLKIIFSLLSFLLSLVVLLACIVAFFIWSGKADLIPNDNGYNLEISKSVLKALPPNVAEVLIKHLQDPMLANLPLQVHFKGQAAKLVSRTTIIAVVSVVFVLLAACAVLFYFYGYKQDIFHLFERQESKSAQVSEELQIETTNA
jgi:predicted PurR-regulated permease PerM